MEEKKRYKGIIPPDGRITIPVAVRKALNIQDNTFYFIELYGKDKILITIIP